MSTIAARVVALTVAVGACACTSYASRASARPAPSGETKVAFAADAVVFEHGRKYAILPAPELSFRRGMSDRWDLGARLGFGAAELASTIALSDSESSALAIVPSFGLGFVPATNNDTDLLRVHGGGRLVWERQAGSRVSVASTIGTRLTVAGPGTIFGGEAGDASLLIEPSVGVGLRIRSGKRIVWPEINMTLPIDTGSGVERPAFQFGIALEL
jgi:hypothetical protein